MKLLFFCVLLLASATASAAGRPTSGDLLRQCQFGIRMDDNDSTLKGPDYVSAAGCLSYLHGVRDALGIAHIEGGPRLLCVPEGVLSSHLARIFVKWAEANPERLHEDALVGAYAALTASFPCKP